jgi:hypothetical protein
MHAEILHMEERLRVAMLASNVPELDALIDEQLLFVGPDGNLYGKADDLELHRSGETQFTRIELDEMQIQQYENTAVVVVLANMAGSFKGQAFAGYNRYTRTWILSPEGWQIVSGSVCAVAR